MQLLGRPASIAVLMLALLMGCDREQRREEEVTARTSVPAVTATITAATPPTIAPTPVQDATPFPAVATATSWWLPRHLELTADDTFRPGNGAYLVDPVSGAIEGWELPRTSLPAGLDNPWFAVSPRGRYLAFGDSYTELPDAQGRRLIKARNLQIFDTRTNSLRFLPNLPVALDDSNTEPIRFSPNELRYVLRATDRLAVVDIDAAVVERQFWVGTSASDTRWDHAASVTWSPDSASLLVRVRDVSAIGGERHRLLRLVVGTGEVREIATGFLDEVLTISPQTARFYTLQRGGAIELRDANDDRLLRRITARDIVLPPGMHPDRTSIHLAAVSRDGHRIAVSADTADPPYATQCPPVIVVDLDQNRTRFWIEGSYCGVGWTADGAWLWSDGKRSGSFGGVVVSADGAVEREASFRHRSPVDGKTAVGATLASFLYGGQSSLRIFDIPSGAVRHDRPLVQAPREGINYRVFWLDDGRIVLLPARGLIQADCFPPDLPELTVHRFGRP